MYRVVGENVIFGDIIQQVFKNRGVKYTEQFLNPSSENILSPYLLTNMDRGVEMFKKHVGDGSESRVSVLVDSDPDGYTSSSMIVSYIRKHFPETNVDYIFHSGRQHGLTPEIMEKLDENLPDFLIIPDASSNDVLQHAELKGKGVDILIADHHDITTEESKDAIIISNHEAISPSYPNKELTGAGIVLKFLEALDKEFGINDSHSYYDLAAVGIVADIATILHPETRYYVYEGLTDVKNPFIQELIYKNAYQVLKKAYPKTVSFSISNYINANIRAGDAESKKTMFRAMLGEEETLHRTYTYRGEQREKTENLAETAYRLAANSRSRQNNLKRRLVRELKDKIDSEKLDDNSFIILALDEFETGYSGFVASDLSDSYRKPVIVSQYNAEKEIYEGSARGYDATMADTRSFLEESGLFNYCSGHEQAFGVSFSAEKLDEINNYLNEAMGEASSSIKVDFEISHKALNEQLVREFHNYEYLWCRGFDEPLVAIKDIELRRSDLQFGNIMKFTVNGVEFTAFQVDDRLKKITEQGKVAVIDIVGKLGVNYWLGKESPQVLIEDLIIKEFKEDDFGEFLF